MLDWYLSRNYSDPWKGELTKGIVWDIYDSSGNIITEVPFIMNQAIRNALMYNTDPNNPKFKKVFLAPSKGNPNTHTLKSGRSILNKFSGRWDWCNVQTPVGTYTGGGGIIYGIDGQILLVAYSKIGREPYSSTNRYMLEIPVSKVEINKNALDSEGTLEKYLCGSSFKNMFFEGSRGTDIKIVYKNLSDPIHTINRPNTNFTDMNAMAQNYIRHNLPKILANTVDI